MESSEQTQNFPQPYLSTSTQSKDTIYTIAHIFIRNSTITH